MAFASHDTLEPVEPVDAPLVPDPIDIGSYRKIRLKPNRQGYWEVWWTERLANGDYGTRHESSKSKIFTKAQAYLDEFCKDAEQNTGTIATPARPVGAARSLTANPTVDSLCARWLDHVAPVGKDKNNGYVLVAVRRALGTLPASRLSDSLLDDYAKLRQRTVKSGTALRELGALRTVLRWAAKQRLISHDDVPPFDKEIMPAESPPRELFLSEDQLRLVWDQLPALGARSISGYRLMLYIAIGLETAARNGALLDLTWDRVNFTLGTVDFRVPGKRVTKKVRVRVPMSNRLRPILEAAAQRAVREGRADTQGNATGRVLEGVTILDEPFKYFFKSIGLPWMTAHVMRHTWGSLRAMRGRSLYEIAKFMGDTLQTVENNYLHLTPDHLRDIANGL